MPTQCCVPLCNNRGGGHTFPAKTELGQQWIVAIRRENARVKGKPWKPTRHSIVCYEHFQPTDYISETRYGKFILYDYQE